MPIYDAAEYVTVEQITPEEQAAGEEPIPAEYIGTQVPSYAYDDPIFQEFGITSMTTERPQAAGPEQEAWDAQFKPILASLNDKIKAHNAKAELHNQKISGVANEKINDYTIIRTKTMTSKEEVKNSTPGVVRFGGDVSFTGNGTNENSQMVVGGTLSTTGAIDQVAKENQEVTNTFGTTEASYTYKRRWPHKSRRRGYKGQIFMTPQVNKENPISLGVAKKEDKNGKAKGEVGANHRKEVQDFLNPFAQDSSNDASKPTAGTNILALPTESLYRIHPESTANYVVETDPQFTNKKAFLSSDYMYKEMKTKPENIEKRLGDGLYEQTLVRNQIVSGTGYRFLDGYTDDESQFKALMDAGIAYAKQHGIVPGVALTAEQAASLTSDMIWLVKDIVMVEGKPVEVIYPKVYLKQSDRLQLHTDGTLMSANTLVMNAKESIRNEGVIQGKTVILTSYQDIINSGHINAGKVGLQSGTTISQQGQIIGRDAVELQAKENITFNNSIEHLTNQDVLHKTAGIAVTGDKGVMIVSAGNDVNLGGAAIEALGKEGAITITAGHDINSTTDTLTAKKDMTQDGDNYLRTYRQTELGTTIEAGGDISIGAKHDVKARNLTVSSDSSAVKVIGEHDVSIENGYSESKDAFALKYKEKGLLNKKETKIKTNDESKNALMSTLSGHTVVVGANNDVTLTSTNVVSTAGTSVLAGHNVITDAAAEHTLSTASKDVKKSGIMGAGMGIMIGKKQSKDNYYIDETTHKATTLGSTDGKVTVQAGDTVHLTTTDIIADKGIKLSGQDIVLDGKEDHYLSKESHEYKSSGLTVSLGGSVANAINTAYGLQQKAKGREDKRLAALEYMEAGKELKTAAANIHDYTSYTAGSVLKKGTELKELGQAQLASAQELKNASLMNRYANTATANVTDYKTKVGKANISKGNAELADLDNNQAGYKAKKRAKADNLVNIRVSIGSSSSRSESSYEANTFDGGSIESNGDIIIEANSADSIKGNIKAVGETISGKTVKLVASNDVSLQAATNTSEKLENAKSKGWSVGANISVAGGGILGFDASANAAKQKSNTKVTTHTGTSVVGSDAVTITSGKDTHISGSKVIGKSVTADVGGNLSIESLQDTKTYVGESSNKGFSVSTNAGSLSNVSMSSSKGKMKSDYASVTDQAGIYAGDGGFVINTAETTSLTGAVIDSTADTNTNKLSTKSLDVKDVENTAEYTSRNVGMSYNHVGNFKNLSKAGQDAVWNTLGKLPNLLPDSSKSSSSTTKSAISNGTIEVRDDDFNMQTLSRDTKDSLNKLDEIFDKKKIEERQELSKLFAKEAFGQLHNWNPTSKEGKAAKAIAHGVVAEVSSRMAGNKPGSGFYAGATNEALIGEIQKIAKEKPDVAQSLSALLGAAVNGSLDYSPVTGAAEAQYGTKWNYQGERNIREYPIAAFLDENGNYYYVDSSGKPIKRSDIKQRNLIVWVQESIGSSVGYTMLINHTGRAGQPLEDSYFYGSLIGQGPNKDTGEWIWLFSDTKSREEFERITGNTRRTDQKPSIMGPVQSTLGIVTNEFTSYKQQNIANYLYDKLSKANQNSASDINTISTLLKLHKELQQYGNQYVIDRRLVNAIEKSANTLGFKYSYDNNLSINANIRKVLSEAKQNYNNTKYIYATVEAGPGIGAQTKLGPASVRANVKAGTKKYINSSKESDTAEANLNIEVAGYEFGPYVSNQVNPLTGATESNIGFKAGKNVLSGSKSKDTTIGVGIGGYAGLGGSGEVGVNVTNIYNSIVGDKSEEDKAYDEVSDLLKNYGG